MRLSSIKFLEENKFYEIKKITQLICDWDYIRKVRMCKNEKHFSRILNI